MLNNKALLLDVNWQPIRFLSWQRAVSLVYVNRAEVLNEWDVSVSSPSITLKLPATIRLITHAVFFKKPRYSKHVLFERDECTCQYCGKALTKSTATIDHILSRSRGGKTSWSNCVVSCEKCNEKKSDKTLENSGFVLIRKPTVPSLKHYVRASVGSSVWHDSWNSFLL